MIMVALFLIIGLLLARALECYLFIKRVSKICFRYNWNHIDANEMLVLEILEDKDFHYTKDWSAYKFLYIKGPSPLNMFFSLNPITLEGQYDKEILKKLKKYELI